MLTTPAANFYTEGLAGVGRGQDNNKRTKKDTKSSSSDSKSDVGSPAQ